MIRGGRPVCNGVEAGTFGRARGQMGLVFRPRSRAPKMDEATGPGCAESSAMADEQEGEKNRGPKGGVKHIPGRGHARKAGPQKKKRFQKKAAKKRKAKQDNLRR